MINGIEKKFVCLEGSNGVGKTTVLKVLSEKYQLKVSKSVPEWFQKYILDVRKLPSDQEYKLYEAAHIAAIMEKTDNNLWIYDRSIYSTIIRIFYKNAKTVDEVFESILKLDIVPELVLIFRCKKEVCYSRRKKEEIIQFLMRIFLNMKMLYMI